MFVCNYTKWTFQFKRKEVHDTGNQACSPFSTVPVLSSPRSFLQPVHYSSFRWICISTGTKEILAKDFIGMATTTMEGQGAQALSKVTEVLEGWGSRGGGS